MPSIVPRGEDRRRESGDDALVPLYPIGPGTYQCGACTCYNGEECTVTPGGWCKCRVPGPYGVTDDLKTQPAEFLTR